MKVLVLGLLACAPAAETPVIQEGLGEADVAAVRALSDEYGRAWLADDSAAVLRVFAEDAALIPHLGNPQVKGHAAIRNHFWPPDSPPARTIVFDRATEEIDGSGDIAWDRGRYSLAFVWQADTIRQSGNYVAVSERGADGAWRWVAYTWNHR